MFTFPDLQGSPKKEHPRRAIEVLLKCDAKHGTPKDKHVLSDSVVHGNKHGIKRKRSIYKTDSLHGKETKKKSPLLFLFHIEPQVHQATLCFITRERGISMIPSKESKEKDICIYNRASCQERDKKTIRSNYQQTLLLRHRPRAMPSSPCRQVTAAYDRAHVPS